MRGKWELTDEELKYWQANAKGQAEAMQRDEIKIVDLTREDITPFQVNQVLESLGRGKDTMNFMVMKVIDMHIINMRMTLIEILLFMEVFWHLNLRFS